MENRATLALEPVRDFLNTVDVEAGTDALASPDMLAAWLAERGTPASRATRAELELAHRLREALRELALAHDEGRPPPPQARRALEAVAAELPLRVTVDHDGELALAPSSGGVRGHLASVLAAVASAGDAWTRLKICPADDCRWAFIDESRNSSRRWCSMEACGNRSKTRAYRHRAVDDR